MSTKSHEITHARHVRVSSKRFPWVPVFVALALVLLGSVAFAATLRFLSPGGDHRATAELETAQTSAQSQSSAAQSQADPQSAAQSEINEPKADPVQFTMVAGGDILTHMPVLDSSWNGDHYDLSQLMAPTAPFIQGADFALCHMEVPVAAQGDAPTGYPLFKAPWETASELAEAGWDGCSTASNHSVDDGFDGLARTLDAFDQAGLGHAGTARTPEESALPQLYEMEKDGQTLKLGHVSFASNLNGNPIPEEQPWSINLNDVQAVLEQARLARDEGAEVVVVSYHCCDVEYTSVPEPLQVETAEALAASGLVDIMISHHAHVPKPMAKVAGGPRGDGMWVTYGTGNFISNQDEECCLAEANTGIISFYDIVKNPDGTITIPQGSWAAVSTELNNGHLVRVITADGAEGSPRSLEEIQWRHQLTVDVLGTDPIPERTTPPANPGTLTVIPRQS